MPDGNVLVENDRSAFVEFDYKGKKHIIELEALVESHSQEGIWVAKRMTIENLE